MERNLSHRPWTDAMARRVSPLNEGESGLREQPIMMRRCLLIWRDKLRPGPIPLAVSLYICTMH